MGEKKLPDIGAEGHLIVHEAMLKKELDALKQKHTRGEITDEDLAHATQRCKEALDEIAKQLGTKLN